MPITMKAPAAERLKRALADAIELADLGGQRVPAEKIAERLFNEEAELMTEISRPWIIERLTWMISRTRRTRLDAASPQMVLTDPVFQGLPKTIFLRNGKRPSIDACTRAQTLDHLRLLRERAESGARITQFEAVVELHEKWSRIQKGIKWGEVVRREAEERAK